MLFLERLCIQDTDAIRVSHEKTPIGESQVEHWVEGSAFLTRVAARHVATLVQSWGARQLLATAEPSNSF